MVVLGLLSPVSRDSPDAVNLSRKCFVAGSSQFLRLRDVFNIFTCSTVRDDDGGDDGDADADAQTDS